MKRIARILGIWPHALTFALLFCLVLAIVEPTFAASEGTSSGTIHVNDVSPSVSSAELWNSGETLNKNASALTVNTECHVNFTVTDDNTLKNLNNVTIIMWESGTASEGASDAERTRYTFTWVNSTDTWASSPSGFITTGNCKDPGSGSSATSYEFTLAFDLSRVATYTSSNTAWKIKIYAYDAGGNAASDATLMFGLAFYSEITITDATHSWGNLNPGATDQQITSSDGDIDFNIVANDNWTVQAKGSGDLTNGANTIALSNVKIHKDTLSSAVSLTQTYADVGGLTNQTAPSSQSGTAADCILWISVPNGAMPGDYTYTLSLQIVHQT